MEVRWKIKEFLEQNGKTPYALWKASGLSRTTVYAITGGQMDGVQFETMGKLMHGLETIMGKQIELTDVLEVVRS
ncbi:helix-turn-helix domain-containing protein [Deinococcus ruber]|uniref:HTH cro/C1-type domain-containing protein n=1 Tax=Deinococcus ruber TaxID=1848197 RepID=A0A918CP92_9DEIO|nr:helix-turn-helix transcriptional regulator [Deinococcus ruber]GGR34096.1 hypothetical protein GCM10008957_50380 [Deinococcus ruber]